MNHLLVFAKYWRPGRVKTRLAAELGGAVASRIHLGFLSATVDRFQEIADRRCLQYAPPEAEPEFIRFVSPRPWEIRPQYGENLGERLTLAAGEAFALGATKIVILGADSPSLPVRFVRQAFHALDRFDVAIGPTEDGGYYLVGLRQEIPALFEEIDWGTSRVMSQTLERLGDRLPSKTFEILPSWYDVDHPKDLERLLDELSRPTHRDDALVRLDGQLRQILKR